GNISRLEPLSRPIREAGGYGPRLPPSLKLRRPSHRNPGEALAKTGRGTTVTATLLQNEPAQVGVLGEVADMLVHIVGVDLDGFAVAVGRGEGYLVEHALHHRLQTAGADILHRRVDGDRNVGEGIDGAVGDIERDAFGLHQ